MAWATASGGAGSAMAEMPAQVVGQFADHRDLPRQDGGRHEIQADLPHLFAEAGHGFAGDRQCGFGRHIAPRRSGAAGGQHEMAVRVIDQFFQRFLDHRLFVGNQARDHFPRRRQRGAEPFLQCGQALVLVDAAGGAVADGDKADQKFVVHGRIINAG